MASLLLVLSYLFSLQDGSGSVPVILLFVGLLMMVFLGGVAFIERVPRKTGGETPVESKRS